MQNGENSWFWFRRHALKYTADAQHLPKEILSDPTVDSASSTVLSVANPWPCKHASSFKQKKAGLGRNLLLPGHVEGLFLSSLWAMARMKMLGRSSWPGICAFIPLAEGGGRKVQPKGRQSSC